MHVLFVILEPDYWWLWLVEVRRRPRAANGREDWRFGRSRAVPGRK